MEFAVTESVGIKNHRVNHNGFSPELESLTTLLPEPKLGIHQEILDGETSFAQQMMIRGAASEKCARPWTFQHGRPGVLPQTARRQGRMEMVWSGESHRTRRTRHSVDTPWRYTDDCVGRTMSTRCWWRDDVQANAGAEALPETTSGRGRTWRLWKMRQSTWTTTPSWTTSSELEVSQKTSIKAFFDHGWA